MKTMKKKRELETSADASGEQNYTEEVYIIIKDDTSNKNNKITKHQVFHFLQNKKL